MGKKTWLLALLVFSPIFFSGCYQPKKGITLRCIGWGDEAETHILQNAVEEFKKNHPDVNVELSRAPYGEYITKVLTQFAGGTAPDVMAVNAEQMISFASRGIFVDLKPYVDKDSTLKLSDFYPEATDHYTVNGVLTALPRDIAPVAVIYYNKNEFDAAGLPYPKDNWDYQQFLETAQKLTKKEGNGRVTQFGFVDFTPTWDAWVYAFGGKLVDNDKNPTRCLLDSPEAAAGAQFRADLINKYHVCPSSADFTAMGGLGNSDLFMNGTAAMFYCGIWTTPQFRTITKFDWDVVEFPKGPKGLRAFPMSAAGYGIVKTCKNPDLAYELVKYLAGETGQKFMASTGLTQPALKTLADSPVFLDGQRPKSKKFLVNAVKYGIFQPVDPNEAEWYQMVASEMDRVFNGDETAAAGLAKMTRVINAKFYKR